MASSIVYQLAYLPKKQPTAATIALVRENGGAAPFKGVTRRERRLAHEIARNLPPGFSCEVRGAPFDGAEERVTLLWVWEGDHAPPFGGYEEPKRWTRWERERALAGKSD